MLDKLFSLAINVADKAGQLEDFLERKQMDDEYMASEEYRRDKALHNSLDNRRLFISKFWITVNFLFFAFTIYQVISGNPIIFRILKLV